MAQNNNVTLPTVRYTRADFTALRALMNKMPLGRVLNLYYCEDDLDALGLTSEADFRRRMDDLRDYLIQRQSDLNPHVASFLSDARKTSVWSKRAIDFLVQVADLEMSLPRPGDHLSFWLRRRIATLLKQEGCLTLGDLINMINVRGHRWYVPIPRIGEKKALAIVGWIRAQSLLKDLLDESSLMPVVLEETTVELNPVLPTLVPLSRIALPRSMTGEDGINRCRAFGQISAKNDLEAIQAYLIKHNEREFPKTHRSYRKELERYLLWCILICRKPLSSILADDCEQYKAFLSSPDSSWIGDKKPYLRAPRHSLRWRPFAKVPSPESQKYAVNVIRTFHAYLVNVNYLMGNPWKEVNDPKVIAPITKLQIEKALPSSLWRKLSAPGGILDELCDTPEDELRKRYPSTGTKKAISAQFRVARAILLLLGESGLRREEAATATRETLRPAPESTKGFWELTVVGKGMKQRTVFFPGRVVDAIRAHWEDRGIVLEDAHNDTPLFAPVVIPDTRTAKNRHLTTYSEGSPVETPYSVDAFGRLVAITLTRIAQDVLLDFELGERNALMMASTHAMRHTFGTTAVENDKPLDVVQFLMGHASLDTTTIYTKAPRKRAIAEMEKDFVG